MNYFYKYIVSKPTFDFYVYLLTPRCIALRWMSTIQYDVTAHVWKHREKYYGQQIQMLEDNKLIVPTN